MARCGCVEKCNCILENGVCTEVAVTITSGGCGSGTLSYAIDVTPDGQTVFCGPGGLNAVLNTIDTNTVDLSGIGTAGNPLQADVILTPNANVPDPDALGTGNLIDSLPGPGGGIYVSCEDVQDCVGAAIGQINAADCLNYDDATNTIQVLICAEPNGIECVPVGDPDCPTGGLSVIPSADASNSLEFGTDDRLFAAASAIAPGDCMTFTGAGTQADPFVVSPQIAAEQNGIECVPGQGLLVAPSAQAGNGLVFGGDQRLFIDRCPFVNAGSQVLVGNTGPCFELVGGTDCVTPMVATLRLSDDICQGLECRADGLFVEVDQTELPPIAEFSSVFGPFGPFNGNINPDLTVFGPFCITMTNPSPCRNMVVSGRLTGFAEVGRTAGAFRTIFDVSESGNPAGPYFNISQMGAHNPNPASRITSNATWTGNDFTIGPGASKTECFRLVVRTQDPGQPLNNARIFAGQVIFQLEGRWSE